MSAEVAVALAVSAAWLAVLAHGLATGWRGHPCGPIVPLVQPGVVLLLAAWAWVALTAGRAEIEAKRAAWEAFKVARACRLVETDRLRGSGKLARQQDGWLCSVGVVYWRRGP